MGSMNWQELNQAIEAEMDHAQIAREEGLEGRARVCARRAAGFAINAFGRERMGSKAKTNAYDLLQWFRDLSIVDPSLREAAARLTVKVNHSFNLPHSQDPLDDAQMIIDALLEDLESGQT
jgi:hypothetical protein